MTGSDWIAIAALTVSGVQRESVCHAAGIQRS